MMRTRLMRAVTGAAAVTVLGVTGVAATAAVQTRLAGPLAAPAPVDEAKMAKAYRNLPLRFEANVGQTDPEARFVARSAGGTLYLTGTEAVLSIAGPHTGQHKLGIADATEATGPAAPAVVRMRPLNANPDVTPVGDGQLPGVSNYLIGNDPAQWHRDVGAYGAVRYPGVYPGIDQVFHGKQNALEYDFEVAPGADPNRISLGLDGPSRITLDAKTGELVLHTTAGEVRQAKPTLYQDVNGSRRAVSGGFTITGGHQVGFHVGAYDHTLPLVIDPVIAYAAIIGGTGEDTPSTIAVDATGAAYIAGTTDSTDFPTKNPLQAANKGQQDFFISKLAPDGSALAYSTYLGGAGNDQYPSIAVDAAGAVYLTGQTDSADFPMAGSSFQPRCGADGTCRLSPTFADGATTLGSPTLTSASAQFADYLDNGRTVTGANIPAGTTITAVVDPTTVTLSANATATGTGSFTIIGRGFPKSYVVVAKLNPGGSATAYSTYLGGSGRDETSSYGGGISVDTDGNAYLTGTTTSIDFPTTDGTVPGTVEGYDRFCGTSVDLNTGRPDGTCNRNVTFTDGSSTAGSPTYKAGLTYFDNRDIGRGITGTNIPAGTTITDIIRPVGVPSYESSDTITLSNNATGTGTGLTFQIIGRNSDYPQSDAFLSKINTRATTGPASLAYSTYLGGSGADQGNAVAVDPPRTFGNFGGVYVVGRTSGGGFPTSPGALQPSCQRQPDPNAPCLFGTDAFVVKLVTEIGGDRSLTAPGTGAFGTYLGASADDYATAVAADTSGVYVTGYAGGPSFPTRNAFQPESSGQTDAFVTKLTSDGGAIVYSSFLGGGGTEGGTGIAVDPSRNVYVTGSTNSPDFPTKDSVLGGTGGFVTKIVPSGSAVEYSTILSVAGQVATNPAGDGAAYVTGGVSASDFPGSATSLHAGPGGGTDAAVVKLVAGNTPAINQLAPRGGPTTGGTPVVITGLHFTGATAVSFSGVAATSFTVNSDTQITAIAPPHADGTIAELTTFVTVTGPQATSLSVGAARYVYGEGIFNATGSCVGGRCPTDGAAVTMANGKVLYTNGTGSRFINDTFPATSQVYDPLAGTWSATGACTGCGFQGQGSGRFSIAVLPAGPPAVCGTSCGKVLVAGGLSVNAPGQGAIPDAFLYDPVAGTWAPTGSMTTARQGQTTTVLPNGKVLVAGGCPVRSCGFSNMTKLLKSAELYDPVTGTWTATGDMTIPRTYHTATLLETATGGCGTNCGKVLIAFGSKADNVGNGVPSAELYDPATGTFTATGSSAGTGRTRHSAVQLADGRVMTVGGTSSGFFGQEFNSAEIYNPATATWSLTGILNFGRGNLPPTTRLPNGKVLVVGGQTTDIAELWDPADGKWHSATSSAFTLRNFPATALLPAGPVSVCGTNCGKVLVAGGTDPNSNIPPLASAELYTPRPSVIGVTPTSASAGATVRIAGTGLASATKVTFGSVSTTAVTHDAVNSDGLLTVAVPARVSGTVDVTVTSPGGVSAAVPAGRFTVRGGFSTFVPVSPARVLDTRVGNGAPVARVGAGQTVDVQVTGRGGVPASGVTAVTLNVTSVQPTAGSYLTAWPTGESRPTASNVNVDAGKIVPNLAVVKVGAGGKVSLYNDAGNVDLLADVAGYYLDPSALVPGSPFASVSPSRILDTRSGVGAPTARVGPGQTVDVQITGRGGAPATGVTAVAVNVTAVNPDAESFVTAWPTGEALPTASNLNTAPGVTRPNMVIVKVGAGGKISLKNDAGTVDLLADVAGFYLDPSATASTFTVVSPSRILDTRTGVGAPAVTVGPGQTIDVQVTGQGGVPATGVTSVVMNVTAVVPTAASFVTVWPAGEARPTASNLNMAPGVTVANLVIVKVGAGGKVHLSNDAGQTHLLADVAGYNAT